MTNNPIDQKMDYLRQCWDHAGLPDAMWHGMKQYLEFGVRPGDFLYSVLCNDLLQSFMSADEENKRLMHRYVNYMIRYISPAAWGDPAAVAGWMEKGGFRS